MQRPFVTADSHSARDIERILNEVFATVPLPEARDLSENKSSKFLKPLRMLDPSKYSLADAAREVGCQYQAAWHLNRAHNLGFDIGRVSGKSKYLAQMLALAQKGYTVQQAADEIGVHYMTIHRAEKVHRTGLKVRGGNRG